MKKIRLKMNHTDVFTLSNAITDYCINSYKGNTYTLLVVHVLVELRLKLERKLLSPHPIKSHHFTATECVAFHIAYLSGLRTLSDVDIAYRLFEAIDRNN